MKAWILYSKRDGILALGSYIIRAAQGLPFSHVSIAIEHDRGIFVYESVWPKSRVITYEEWSSHYVEVKRHRLPDVELSHVRALDSLMNKTYSVSQLVVIYFNMFTSKLDLAWLNGSRKLICTELAAFFFRLAYGLAWSKSLDMISLRDIYREARKLEVK